MNQGMTGDDAYAILNKKIRNLQLSGGGVTDYRDMTGKPSINGVELVGNISLKDLGIREMSESDVEKIIDSIGGL